MFLASGPCLCAPGQLCWWEGGVVSLQLVPEGPVTLFPECRASSRAGTCIYLYLLEQLPHLVSCGQASYLKNIRDWGSPQRTTLSPLL